MNLKKAALLAILCVAAVPAMAKSKPAVDNGHAEFVMKRTTVKGFFIHVVTLGHKGN